MPAAQLDVPRGRQVLLLAVLANEFVLASEERRRGRARSTPPKHRAGADTAPFAQMLAEERDGLW